MSSTIEDDHRHRPLTSDRLRVMLAKDATGRFGEAVAARYLTGIGFELLDRNWRCAAGELDIVARDAATTVFCEVKCRSTAAFGDPAAAITYPKLRRIRALAGRWLADHPDHRSSEIRFDVVSIVREPGRRTTLRHLRGAF